MRTLFTFLVGLFACLTVEAQNVQPYYRDIKLPRQGVLEVQDFTNPIAASGTTISDDAAGNISTAATTLTTFTSQPDLPRNIVITPGSTTADVAACTVVVNGTNFKGASISENFAFSANTTVATVGSKAFKTVTSVVFPANCEDSPFGATWDIGVGEKLGLRQCMAQAGDWGWSSIDGVYESTRATVTADADELEKNVADFNGTMDGSSDFKAFFIQNYRCY